MAIAMDPAISELLRIHSWHGRPASFACPLYLRLLSGTCRPCACRESGAPLTHVQTYLTDRVAAGPLLRRHATVARCLSQSVLAGPRPRTALARVFPLAPDPKADALFALAGSGTRGKCAEALTLNSGWKSRRWCCPRARAARLLECQYFALTVQTRQHRPASLLNGGNTPRHAFQAGHRSCLRYTSGSH